MALEFPVNQARRFRSAPDFEREKGSPLHPRARTQARWNRRNARIANFVRARRATARVTRGRQMFQRNSIVSRYKSLKKFGLRFFTIYFRLHLNRNLLEFIFIRMIILYSSFAFELLFFCIYEQDTYSHEF